MAMKEHPELLERNAGLIPVKETEPVRPEGLSDEEDKELKSRAQALVNGLAEAEGGETTVSCFILTTARSRGSG